MVSWASLTIMNQPVYMRIHVATWSPAHLTSEAMCPSICVIYFAPGPQRHGTNGWLIRSSLQGLPCGPHLKGKHQTVSGRHKHKNMKNINKLKKKTGSLITFVHIRQAASSKQIRRSIYLRNLYSMIFRTYYTMLRVSSLAVGLSMPPQCIMLPMAPCKASLGLAVA